MRTVAALLSLALSVAATGLLPDACNGAGRSGPTAGADGVLTTSGSTPNDCAGAAPTCYTITGDDCCNEPSAPAVCGPKDAPKGTHLKWLCEGVLTLASSCRGVGTSCVPRATLGGDATRAPHAAVPLVAFDSDAAAPASDAGKPKKKRR